MAIFQIQKIEGKPSVQKIDEEVTQKENGAAHEEEELQAAKEVVGDKAIEGETPKGEETDGNKEVFTLGENNTEKAAVVKVDGPLGRVFTQALNKMLAVEGMAAIPLTNEAFELMRKNKEVEVINVKAIDTAFVNTEDAVEITDDIVKHPNENFVLAMESRSSKVTNCAGLLSGLDKLKNTQVQYRVESAAARVVELLVK